MLFKKGIYGSGLVGKLSIKVIVRIEQVVMRSVWHNIYADCRPTFEGDRGTIILVLKLIRRSAKNFRLILIRGCIIQLLPVQVYLAVEN